MTYEASHDSFIGPAGGHIEREYSEATAREIDTAVRDIISRVFERSLALLQARREVLETCARTLLERETLDEHDLQRLTGTAQDSQPADSATTATG